MTLQETLAEAAPLAFDAALTLVLTLVGLSAELSGLNSLGESTALALWFGVMGAVALYGGLVLVGRDRLLPRVRAL
ncbi:hypothetical protein [Halosegnis longus]|uniref:DUF8151 domain-containing protein n=1 Tax=Halosegnis longus TaxID=2216012 RepID=A0AAJ4R9Y9_9EURY|nr:MULTISPECIES: hypothetical protein [Halobacteriales]RNJ27301.1 hypothetical protein Nmn1133_11840 [Salella cibi]